MHRKCQQSYFYFVEHVPGLHQLNGVAMDLIYEIYGYYNRDLQLDGNRRSVANLAATRCTASSLSTVRLVYGLLYTEIYHR